MVSKSESSTEMVEGDVVYEKEGNTSQSVSSMGSPGDVTSSSKKGYDGAYPSQKDQTCLLSQEQMELPYSVIQNESNSLVYCTPGCNTCASGKIVAVEGQSLAQQPYTSTECQGQNVSYVSESLPDYSRDSKPAVGDAKFPDGSKPETTSASPGAQLNTKVSNSTKTKAYVDAKDSAKPISLKPYWTVSPSKFPVKDNKPLDKAPRLSSGMQSLRGRNESHHNLGQDGHFPRYGLTKSMSVGWAVNSDGRFHSSEMRNSHKNCEASIELVRGPRANSLKSSLNSFSDKNNLNHLIHRDQYNKSEFQIIYKQAKFFMIKSYSEDDIHKSIKYNVWSSTPNGNKKLDAAFRDAEIESRKSTKRPIFLFFSVNSSGQFVGLAEMAGPVDFKKNMDFWQQDKWNGFFPVMWHIIKDIPNRVFQNITLENNDNRAVTFSRDTQEIGLPQGLRMLHIFKDYPLGTSLLDDFDFYDKREKLLHATRSSHPMMPISEVEFDNDGYSVKHLETTVRNLSTPAKPGRPSSDPNSSLVTVTRNLSINCP